MAFKTAAGYGNLPNGNFSPVIYSKKVQSAFRKTSIIEDITNFRKFIFFHFKKPFIYLPKTSNSTFTKSFFLIKIRFVSLRVCGITTI